MSIKFPEGFLWGSATASFQIEGATRADGRGESIWDRFAATPGKVLNGDTGEPACNSYYRYQEDIALLKAMNSQSYRFSIAWPRIIPDGDGIIAEAGLDYYDRLVDALLAADIMPYVTLYHWDLPQALQDKGGWANRATIEAFVRYTGIVAARLGDRVPMWGTLNEPWCISILSNEIGEHAPGLHDRKIALQVAHNILVAHGLAVPVIRQHNPGSQVGIVLNMEPSYPAMDTAADHALADLHNARFNRWFLDPIMGKGYPQVAWDDYGEDVPEIEAGDMDIMQAPIDYLGLNYYTRKVVHDPAGGEGPVLHQRDNANVSERDWEIYPQALYDLLTWMHQDYPQIQAYYISENGISCPDVLEDGAVHDVQRIDYFRQHFAATARAIEAGVPVKGYFAWSLLDNFEWAFGYGSRFGLTYIDFETQDRTLKDSGHWFGRVATANAIVE